MDAGREDDVAAVAARIESGTLTVYGHTRAVADLALRQLEVIVGAVPGADVQRRRERPVALLEDGEGLGPGEPASLRWVAVYVEDPHTRHAAGREADVELPVPPHGADGLGVGARVLEPVRSRWQLVALAQREHGPTFLARVNEGHLAHLASRHCLHLSAPGEDAGA